MVCQLEPSVARLGPRLVYPEDPQDKPDRRPLSVHPVPKGAIFSSAVHSANRRGTVAGGVPARGLI